MLDRREVNELCRLGGSWRISNLILLHLDCEGKSKTVKGSNSHIEASIL
jgi:hypothetical protein